MAATSAAFDRVYEERVVNNTMCEVPAYYRTRKDRYVKTFRVIESLGLPPGSTVLEIGGGQTALLCAGLLGHEGTVWDLSERYRESITRHGLEFGVCDMVHDDPPVRERFDLVLFLEVIEHCPMPGHLVLEKIGRWLKPGGRVIVTTPNLYRLRNLVRFAMGKQVLTEFRYPARGEGIGHFIEYTEKHLRWQIEKAGLEVERLDLVQLTNVGFTAKARVQRWLSKPLLARRIWRDSLLAVARKPAGAEIAKA